MRAEPARTGHGLQQLLKRFFVGVFDIEVGHLASNFKVFLDSLGEVRRIDATLPRFTAERLVLL